MNNPTDLDPGATFVAHLEGESNADVHAVLVGSLRVVIIEDEDHWFAQGLEIDYAASGLDMDDVKDRFQQGLAATIHEHLRMYGTVEPLLKVAPQEAWDLLFTADTHHRLTCASLHAFDSAVEDARHQRKLSFPFSRIAFLQPATA